jgi:hypothetical protein
VKYKICVLYVEKFTSCLDLKCAANTLKVVGNEKEGGSGRWQMIELVSNLGDQGLFSFTFFCRL